MLYDFGISTNPNEFISIVVSAVTDSVVTAVAANGGYQAVAITITKGFPFFNVVRLTIRNRSLVVLDIDYTVHGLVLPETEYYLTTGLSPGE